MARTFREQRDYTFASEALMWEGEALARTTFREAIRSPTGATRQHVSMDVGEMFTATGKEFDVLLAELAAEGMAPSRTHVALYDDDDYSHFPSTISARPESRELTITIRGADEGAVLALAAKLDRLIPPLTNCTTPRPALASNLRGDARSSTHHPPPTVAPEHEGWLRRTWRDHAMTFVLTVLGTVVAALLIVWFGLG